MQQQLGPYQLIREAGRGAMSTVYEAVDTRIGRTVAVKVLALPQHLTPEERIVQSARLSREAKAVARLSHPNIVTIFDVGSTPAGEIINGEEEAVPYLVMEYLQGQTLRARLALSGALRAEEAAIILDQVARALDVAHGAGIVHRDIKPSNIMLLPDGAVKLMDFGVARQDDDSGETVTQAGMMVGSPAYMSPEQVRGETASADSDLWALGVVLYEMLAGRSPFGGGSIPATLFRIAHSQPAPLEGFDEDVQAVLGRALNADPARRFPSARALADAFQEAAFQRKTEEPTILPAAAAIAASSSFATASSSAAPAAAALEAEESAITGFKRGAALGALSSAPLVRESATAYSPGTTASAPLRDTDSPIRRERSFPWGYALLGSLLFAGGIALPILSARQDRPLTKPMPAVIAPADLEPTVALPREEAPDSSRVAATGPPPSRPSSSAASSGEAGEMPSPAQRKPAAKPAVVIAPRRPAPLPQEQQQSPTPAPGRVIVAEKTAPVRKPLPEIYGTLEPPSAERRQPQRRPRQTDPRPESLPRREEPTAQPGLVVDPPGPVVVEPVAPTPAPAPPAIAARKEPEDAPASTADDVLGEELTFRGTWRGTHTRHPAILEITREEHDGTFKGNLTLETAKGPVVLEVEGSINDESGSPIITLREKKVREQPAPNSWDLGVNTGRLTAGGRIVGTGRDTRGRTYSWSFRR